MPERQVRPMAAALRRRLAATLQRPFASLPSRIVMSVFVATLVTSLAVTWISTHSIGSFLGRLIDQKFQLILLTSGERLEKWYAQRAADIETLAHSRVAVESLGPEVEDAHRGLRARPRDEARKQLGSVLEKSPQFEALFVLGDDGTTLLWVGVQHELSPELRRELAAVARPTVGPARREGRHLIQVASSPVDAAGTALSLHGLVRIDAAASQLRSNDLGATGAIYVVDAAGAVVMGTPGSDLGKRHTSLIPVGSAAPAAGDYTRPSGERVVARAVRFGQFGWTIMVEESYDAAFHPVVSVIQKILAINLAIVAVFSGAAFWIARSIVRPIQALSDGALRIAGGDTDVAIPGRNRHDEIGVLTRAFYEMMIRLNLNQEELEEKRGEIENANHRLIAQNLELQRINDVFEQLSITDDLTKLHNHRFFQEHLPREMIRASRTGESLSLILIDIDDFKQLNDHYGHSVGDAVLRRVADVMSAQIRDMDLLARYGGEEFALLASRTTLEGAAALAEKLRMAVAAARFSVVALDGPTEIRVTVSSGVSVYRGDERAFFNEADRALYRAKESGKDCVVVSGEGDASPRTSDA